MEWIDSDQENIASSGWATLTSYAGLIPDDRLPIDLYSTLLNQVETTLHNSPNRVRYTMNGFVIGTGGSISSLTDKAKKIAEIIGKVSVNMGDTACKVPLASAYIKKIENRNSIGKKRTSTRC